ncbi:hypothetical protein EJ06DRAFT_550317 [Trichodelitschia bisporula]|uniref:TPR-like protein n=1 Tax=Trichodelitschia bisporula TaxID=703511 RepID=A0A6G1HR86_9PEZI|nr:hypothetical protein EJ06DRAFT_550317 [Trichodelitschia bisporula]
MDNVRAHRLSAARGHGRTHSGDERRRVALLKPSTKGPLEEQEDPLSDSMISSRPTSPPTSVRSSTPRPFSPALSTASSTIDPISTTKDLSFLLRPENFHPLPTPTLPAAFLRSPHAPTPNTPLATLLAGGHFHAAASTAVRQLTSLPVSAAPDTIFALYYTRLACLTLVNQTSLAATEAKVLGDLTSAFYTHPITGAHIVPWPLRVLAVRLQALGFGEWRRGIMAYYVLAQDARQEITRARQEAHPEEEALWLSRLHDLGIRVASALVEMGDLESAGRHLRTLQTAGPEDNTRQAAVMEALVWFRVGDLAAARACAERVAGKSEGRASTAAPSSDDGESTREDQDEFSGDITTRILWALSHTAAGAFPVAISAWRALHADFPHDGLVAQNLAVCLLYTGQLTEARGILEGLIDDPEIPAFQALLFNLCTVYELCTERAKEMKGKLIERVASKEPMGSGWGFATTEFKLEPGVGVS